MQPSSLLVSLGLALRHVNRPATSHWNSPYPLASHPQLAATHTGTALPAAFSTCVFTSTSRTGHHNVSHFPCPHAPLFASPLRCCSQPYERSLRRPYFHVKPLEPSQLAVWARYLDFSQEQGDAAATVRLHERCLVACANYPGACVLARKGIWARACARVGACV